ncbi:MAG: hypothetical protein J6Q11_05705 [Fibrobacteraceae bacterium]|nr:hypothetical protein [Fibrobacteraceae bacterium]
MHKVFLLFLLFSLFSVTNAITISTLDEQFSQNKILGSIIEHSPHENSTKQAYDNFFENTFNWDLDFNSGSSVIFYVGNDFQWNGTIQVHQDTKVTWAPFLRETVNAVIAGVYN